MTDPWDEQAITFVAEKEERQLWELLLHEERGFESRGNVFLAAEAVFVLAYGIVVAFSPLHAAFFAVVGLGVSLVWLILQWKNLGDLAKLSARFKRIATAKHYLAWRDETRRFILRHEVIAVVIPALSLVAWFVALAFAS